MGVKVFRSTVFLASMALVVCPGAGAMSAAPGSMITSYFHHETAGYLGVDFEDLTSKQRSEFHLQSKQGVAIAAVDHDAPAGQAGLRAQDVVLEMNGQPAQSAAQLRGILRKTTAGQTVNLTILRDGQTIEKSVQLGDRKVVEQRAWSQHYTVPDPTQESAMDMQEGNPQAQPPAQPEQGFIGQATSELGKTFGSNGVLMSLIPGTNSLYTGVEVDILGPQLAQYFDVKDGVGLLVRVAGGPPCGGHRVEGRRRADGFPQQVAACPPRES